MREYQPEQKTEKQVLKVKELENAIVKIYREIKEINAKK